MEPDRGLSAERLCEDIFAVRGRGWQWKVIHMEDTKKCVTYASAIAARDCDARNNGEREREKKKKKNFITQG